MIVKKASTPRLFWIISFLFIALNSIAIYEEQYWFTLSPLLLIFIFLYLFKLNILFDILIFVTPLSIQLSEFLPSLGFDLFLPTEAMLFVFMLIVLFKFSLNLGINQSFIKHPVSIMIIIYLLWILVSGLAGTMPVVSIKYFIVKMWYISIFYFYFSILIKSNFDIKKFIWLYIIPLSIVVIYTLIRLGGFGFNNFKAAHFVMSPFFRDHTIYGAIVAFYIPPSIALFFSKINHKYKFLLSVIIIILLLGLIFSYTRAAWLSLVGSLAVFIILRLKIKLRYLLLSLLAVLIFSFQIWWSIYFDLKENKQDSSANFTEHVESMSNIATDASNLERINRWKSAIRLFEVKPFMGWGPGTYQFQYAKYQFSYDKTIISTDFGDGGNAHSEYLGLLSETGIPGMLIFIGIILLVVRSAIRIYKTTDDNELKILILGLLLGLISYYLHGLLNNYLDTDKASVPFWGFSSLIVYFDIVVHNKIKLKKFN